MKSLHDSAALAMARRAGLISVLTGLLVATAHPAQAGPITDPALDFLPTFLGPKNLDLDVLSAEVLLDTHNFTLHAVLNGPVGTTVGGFYVWGFDRGSHTQGFPVIAPGVLFDTVVVLRANGTTNAAGGIVTISGNEITGVIPRGDLPSVGLLSQEQFMWNLWPRSVAIAGNPDGNVADFAPNNSDAAITFVPEPPSLALFGFGVFVLGVWRYRRPKYGLKSV
jgi:hypothetical protein